MSYYAPSEQSDFSGSVACPAKPLAEEGTTRGYNIDLDSNLHFTTRILKTQEIHKPLRYGLYILFFHQMIKQEHSHRFRIRVSKRYAYFHGKFFS